MKQTTAVEAVKRPPTLFDIEVGWIPLLEARIAAETDPDLGEERPVCQCCAGRGDIARTLPGDVAQPCEVCEGSGREKSARERAIEAADVALADHAQVEIQKVDSYVGILGYLEAAIATRRAEAKRQTTVVGVLERMLDQVKATAVFAITAVPGRKRVDGTRGYLLAKANGGVAPLLIADPSLVPDELCRLEGWLNAHDLTVMIEATRRRIFKPDWEPKARWTARVPDNTAIRAKLAEPCPACGGPDGPKEEEGVGQTVCATCGGSGKQAVPGAVLGDRGVHLEVK